MRVPYLLLILCLSSLIGCSGGGDATSSSDENVASDNAGSDTNDGSSTGDTNPAPNPNPNPNPGPVITASPGELVGQSTPDPDPGAQYPPNTDPVAFVTDYQMEPGSDRIRPIIEISHYPSDYTANSSGTLQFWAADDVNGSGLRTIECSIDGAAFQDCGTQLDLSNLSEGIHQVRAIARDWDRNESTEVSYAFYVDQTPPSVAFASTPPMVTAQSDANFQFASDDAGSGVSHYECRIDTGTTGQCNDTELFQNLPEGDRAVYVRAVDNVGNQSGSITHRFTVDQSAPMIQINEQPGAQTYTNNDATINFTVNDTYSPMGVTLACSLNGVAVNCMNSVDTNVPAPVPMTFTYMITATDVVGNSSSQTITWNAVNIAEDRMTNISVSDDRPVDILFVIDNSGSMNFERSNLAQRIDGMINVINGLDWQIAVISTDSSSNGANRDGNFVELDGLPGQYILDSNMDQAMAQTVFGDTVQNIPGGSGTEEGIYSSKRVIDRYLAGDTLHNSFIRDGADLSIVVLSDEDEASQGGSAARITPQGFVDFVDTSFNGQKNMVFHSIITRPGDSTCLSGEGAYYGDEYDALSRLTGFGQTGGAIIGSVCNQDYTGQLQDIGQSVKDSQNSIRLQCAPFDADGDGTPDVTVRYRPDAGSAYQVYSGARAYNGDLVTFTDLLPPGDYQVDYQCRIN